MACASRVLPRRPSVSFLNCRLSAQVSHYTQAVKNRLRRVFLHETEPFSPWTKAVWPGKEFHPKQFRAPVILFKRPRQPYFKVKDREMGWGARSLSGVRVCIVNIAAHKEMLREPAVQVIAEQLRDALHRIEKGELSQCMRWWSWGQRRVTAICLLRQGKYCQAGVV